MDIDLATGLPEVPEDFFWSVEWGTCVLNEEEPVQTVKVLQVKLCKNDTAKRYRTTWSTDHSWKNLWFGESVSWEDTTISEIMSEDLIDFEVCSAKMYFGSLVYGGWEIIENRLTKSPYLVYLYRVQESTPENVLKTATKLYKKYQEEQAKQVREAKQAHIAEGLLGTYPPKKLEATKA